MKRMLMTVIGLCTIIQCTGRGRDILGTDLYSAFYTGKAGLSAGHRISRHWSAGFSVSMDLCVRQREAGNVTEDFMSTSISVSFWPEAVFNGPFLSIGATAGDRQGACCTAGAGYAIHIWKGLTTGFMYKVRLSEASGQDKGTINIGIGYAF